MVHEKFRWMKMRIINRYRISWRFKKLPSSLIILKTWRNVVRALIKGSLFEGANTIASPYFAPVTAIFYLFSQSILNFVDILSIFLVCFASGTNFPRFTMVKKLKTDIFFTDVSVFYWTITFYSSVEWNTAIFMELLHSCVECNLVRR